MSNLNEKEILENIKKSIENDVPDVWEKIRDTESCKYDLKSKPEKPDRRMVRWAAAAAVIAVVGFTGIGMNMINLSRDNGRIEDYSSTPGDAAGIIQPGLPEIDTGGIPGTTVPADIFRPFIKDVKADEAARAMSINIAEPAWLPDGYKQISSQLFCYDEGGSKPYMYQMRFTNSSGNDITISVQKYMNEKEKLESQPEPMTEPMTQPAAKVIPPAAPVPPDALVPPDAPVQSEPRYNPTDAAVPPKAADLPASTSNVGSTPSAGGGITGSTGNGAAVSVEVIRVTIESIDVDMTLFNNSQAVSAFWVHEGCTYSISTGGISKDDMTGIIESMVK